MSNDVADRIAAASPHLNDAVDARLVVATLGTELCLCDLATIVERDEDDVFARLERLVEAGVMVHRSPGTMNYFHFDRDGDGGTLSAAIDTLLNRRLIPRKEPT